MDYKIHISNGRELAEIISGDLLIRSAGDILGLKTGVHSRAFFIRKDIRHE